MEVKKRLGRDGLISMMWMKKNWKWVLLGCAVVIILFVLVIISMITQMQQKACFFVYDQPERVTEIRVESEKCNSKKYTVLDLSVFKNLKSVVIGDDSYRYVTELKFGGLKSLESIEIGDYCFYDAQSLELKSVLIQIE